MKKWELGLDCICAYLVIYIISLVGIDMFVIGGPFSGDDELILCEKKTYQDERV